ncbi:diadenylate cyclase CdaA [Bacteroidales bacterium OttesenSCG-928-J19]|nr:diadenylate cyclase CdaA [Bacteroidales bacterium OttesenSCG-928-J19]
MLFHFGIKDAIDVLLVAFLLYEVWLLMKKTKTTAIFLGVISFFLVWLLVSQVFEMRLTGAILDKIVDVGLLILIIVFQKEIREFLQNLGTNKWIRWFINIFKPKGRNAGVDEDISTIMPIVLAVMDMSKRKEGALIAIQQDDLLDTFVETGEEINGNISSRLIENIFFKNSPLHDGAMIIVGKKIKAAGCILPVSQRHDIPKELGLRHRSALGLSEETDAKVIIVSEERGKISVAHRGHLNIDITAEELQKILVRKSD